MLTIDLLNAIPREMLMPQASQLFFTILSALLLLLALGYMVLKIKQRGDLIPLYAYLGAALAFVNEPFADYLVLAYFPEQGQFTALKLLDRELPVFMAMLYVWYIAPFSVYLLDWVERGISKSAWWKFFLATLVAVILLEEVGIGLGLWIYYGDQPFRPFGLPLWVPFGFMAVVYGYAAALYGLTRGLPDRLYWMIVPGCALASASTHFASAFPVTVAMYSTTNPWIVHGAAVTAIAICLAFIWALSLAFGKDPAVKHSPD